MVGQNKNKKLVETYIKNNSLPRFIILTGTEGSGKKTFSKYLASITNSEHITYGNKVEDVRNAINLAYTQNKNIFYCITGYENMRAEAKNALLKLAEEPPTGSYVVLTATIKNEVLPTLISRGILIELEDYTKEELKEFAVANNFNYDYINLCDTPKDVIDIQNIKCEEFVQFVNNVWNKITLASQGNALKITNSLSLKDEQNGYNPLLFINCIYNKVFEHLKKENPNKVLESGYKLMLLCSDTKRKLFLRYNKNFLMDRFILNFKELMNGII